LAVRRVPAPVAGVAHNRPCVWNAALEMSGNRQLAQDRDPCRGKAFDAWALSPPPPPHPSMEPSQEDQERIALENKDRQCEVAGGLRDFNFCSLWLGGIPVGPPVGAASPRSAARRCASLAAPGLTAEALRSVKSVMVQASSAKEAQQIVRSTLVELGILQELVVDATSTEGAEVETGHELVVHPPDNLDRQFLGVDAAGNLPDVDPELGEGGDDKRGLGQGGASAGGEDGAVWCPDCEMWLNGPTQWEDHKIGKKT